MTTNSEQAGAQMTPAERVAYGALGAGLAVLGLRGGHPVQRLLLSAAGVVVAAQAITGRHPVATALKINQGADGEVRVSDAVTIGQGPEGLYARWRDLASLPALMTHLEKVEVLDEKRSRWTVKAPAGTHVSWEAEITAEEPGRRLAWASLPGAAVENSGEVLFRPAPGNRGTELVVRLSYKPPGGAAGAVVARMLGQEPGQQLRDDLMRFKREQELGYAPTARGQSSGRAGAGKGTQEGRV
jgi:uncharacterized membrane protein